MFDDFFNSLKNAMLAKAKEAVDELGKRLAVPEPAGSFTLVRRFTLDDGTITKGGIALIDGWWQIEAYDDDRRDQFVSMSEPLRSVILFEVPEPDVSECVFACRFLAKSRSEKPIKVSLGLRHVRSWGTDTRSWSREVPTSAEFAAYEVRAHYKKESDPTWVQISVQFESSGILQLRDVELLQAPVKA